MAFVHGRNVVVTLDADDLSAFANNVAFNRSADSHDTTTYGRNAKTYQGGLKDGTATISGVYDNSASAGPRAVISPLLGTTCVLVYKPEGTGTGKPVSTVDAVVTGYEETAPVADMVTWSCSLQLSGEVVNSVSA